MTIDLVSFIAGAFVGALFYMVIYYYLLYKSYKGVVTQLTSQAAGARQHQEQDAAGEKIPPAPAKNPIGFLWDGK
ncbi:hypothetical protein D3C87_1185270 [compost metagenome]